MEFLAQLFIDGFLGIKQGVEGLKNQSQRPKRLDKLKVTPSLEETILKLRSEKK